MRSNTEEELKKHRCCFTGHRPYKLGISEVKTKKLLKQAIRQAIADGYVTFITGMAMGIDMWAAEIVLEERNKNDEIHLICAVPHPDFEKHWSTDEQNRYKNILERADVIRTISEHAYKACYQKRNQWMVDRSSLVIAAYNGESGGTKNTIDYALKNDVKIKNILE